MTIAEHTAEAKDRQTGSPLEVLLVFLKLGVTCFGGPIAHIGYFREEFVVRRKWIDEHAYADLVGLCQLLPGPASSQVGFAVGLMGLVYYDKMSRRRPTRPFGPGAAYVEELRAGRTGLTDARRLSAMIAVGIGMHNLSEGLAIGQSAAKGEISLALMLIIGFALHNATEGFGIVAPLAAEEERPTWAFLITMGLIGGGPTFVGTIIGNAWVNDGLFVVFLALAAGSILYVVIQLLKVASKQGFEEIVMWAIFFGIVAGFATDYVLVAAGV